MGHVGSQSKAEATRFDKKKNWFLNHPFFSTIILIVVIVVGFGALTKSTSELWDIASRIFRTETEQLSTDFIAISTTLVLIEKGTYTQEDASKIREIYFHLANLAGYQGQFHIVLREYIREVLEGESAENLKSSWNEIKKSLERLGPFVASLAAEVRRSRSDVWLQLSDDLISLHGGMASRSSLLDELSNFSLPQNQSEIQRLQQIADTYEILIIRLKIATKALARELED